MRTEIRRVHLQSDAFEGGDVRVLAAAFSAEEEGATETVVIVTTLTRQGNLADKVEGFENDVVATQRSLAADQELAAKLAGSCGCKSSEWEERRKSKAGEVLAHTNEACTTTMRSSFKAAFPIPSLSQVPRSIAVFMKFRRPPTASRKFGVRPRGMALALSGKSVEITGDPFTSETSEELLPKRTQNPKTK